MAGLAPVTLVAPGNLGLNLERENTLLSADWCTEANNVILNKQGRIATRNGWTDQTTNPISGNTDIDMMHEYINEAGTSVMICASGTKIFKDIDDFTDANNDITSTTAPGADDWQFTNFNNKVLGQNDGEITVVKTGGDFADITAASGSLPTGRCIHGAFGRVWASNTDNQTLKYSALLDETHWTTGAGSVDMSSVWTNGMDEIMAITSVGATLVVFGKRHIIFWVDGSGSEIGLDLTQMYVSDIIEGTGCISQFSLQVLGEGDVIFLSRGGLQLLSRVIANKNNPLATITKHIRTELAHYIKQETLTNVRSGYSPDEGFYLITFPGSAKMLYVNLFRLFEDEDGDFVAPITFWTMSPNVPKSIVVRDNGDILFGFNGVVGKYGGFVDKATAFNLAYWSGYMDLWADFDASERLKMLKGMTAYVKVGVTTTVTWRWSFDFGSDTFSENAKYTVGSTLAEWGTAEWGTNEYAGFILATKKTVEGKGEGQYIRIGFTMTISSFDFILNHIQLAPKIGRLLAP